MHSVFHITEDELGTRLSDHLELHFLELPKLKRYNESKEDELLVEWAEFLSVRNEMELMEMKSHELSEEIIKAFEELEELSKDPAMREIALNREMALRDYIQRMRDAETEGIEQGVNLASHNIAKALKLQGLSIDLIAAATGLSIEEIDTL
jgi:predicted transposase/invertase (TIGR01784 family)